MDTKQSWYNLQSTEEPQTVDVLISIELWLKKKKKEEIMILMLQSGETTWVCVCVCVCVCACARVDSEWRVKKQGSILGHRIYK